MRTHRIEFRTETQDWSRMHPERRYSGSEAEMTALLTGALAAPPFAGAGEYRVVATLAFLTGPDGAEDRDGMSAAGIADVIARVARRSAERRLAQHHTQFGSLDPEDKADLAEILRGSSTAHERILLGRAIRTLMGASE